MRLVCVEPGSGVVCSWQQMALLRIEKRKKCPTKTHLSLILERRGALKPHLSNMEELLIVINCLQLILGVQNVGERKPLCGVNLNPCFIWATYFFLPPMFPLSLFKKERKNGHRYLHKIEPEFGRTGGGGC